MSDVADLLGPAKELLFSAANLAYEAPRLADAGHEALFFHAGAFTPAQHEPVARFLLARPQIAQVFNFGMVGTFWPKELADQQPCDWHANQLARFGVARERLVSRPTARNTLEEIQQALAEPAIASAGRVWVLCHDPQALRVRLLWDKLASMPRVHIRPGGWETDWKRIAQEVFRIRTYSRAGDQAMPRPEEDAVIQEVFDRMATEFPEVYRERVDEMRPFLERRGLDVRGLFSKNDAHSVI